MNNKGNSNLLVVLAVAGVALVVGFVLGVWGESLNDKLGKAYYDAQYFVGDVYQGQSQVQMMTGGEFVGPIDSSKSLDVDATSTLSGDNVRITHPTLAGTVTTLTAGATTSAPTGAQVCDTRIFVWEPGGANSTTTLPGAAALYADCLTTNGDGLELLFVNATGTNVVNIVAGASTTLLIDQGASSSVIIGANATARLQLWRRSVTDLQAIVEVLVDGD